MLSLSESLVLAVVAVVEGRAGGVGWPTLGDGLLVLGVISAGEGEMLTTRANVLLGGDAQSHHNGIGCRDGR